MKYSYTKLFWILLVVLLFGIVIFQPAKVIFGYIFDGSVVITNPNQQLRDWGNEPFDKVKWENGDQTMRGSMIKNLLATNDFRKLSYEQITEIVGNKNRYYYVQDGIPAYEVHLNNKPYLLILLKDIETSTANTKAILKPCRIEQYVDESGINKSFTACH